MKVELAHDILAQKVYERVSTEEKRIREVERLIQERFAFYQGEPKLSAEEVDYIRPYLKKVHVSEEEKEFVEQSWRRQTAQRIRRLLVWAIVLLLFLILLGGGIFLRQTIQHNKEIKAKNEEILAQKAKIDSANAVLRVINVDLKKARDEARQNEAEAKKQARIARINADEAERQAEIARIEAERAEREAERANQNADEAQKARALAEEKRKEAEKAEAFAQEQRRIAEEKARAVNLLIAQQLAEQSLKISNDDTLKGLLAREGYRIYEYFRINKEDTTKVYAGAYNTPIYQALYGGLPDSLKKANQFSAIPPGQPPSQIRTILVQDEKIYTLTTNGRTQQWEWNPQQVSLKQVSSSQQGDDRGIYYALALPEGVPTGLALNDQTGAEVVLGTDSVTSMKRWVSAHKVRLVGYDSPDQVRLIVTEDSVFTWDDPDGLPQALSALPVRGRWRAMAQHPNGKLMAGVDPRGMLRYWKLAADGSFQQQDSVPGISSVVAFHPTKEELAYGKRGGDLGMIKVYTNEPEILLRGHKAGVTDITFSRDGQFLASSSRDQSVQLWHIKGDNYLRNGPLRMDQEQGMVMSLAFSPDATALFAGDAKGILRSWPLDMGYWFKRLSGIFGEDTKLTQEEVVRFISTEEDFIDQGLDDCLTEYVPFPD